MRLFVGSQAASVRGERVTLGGDRCFSAAHPQLPGCFTEGEGEIVGLLDSGAFTDRERLTPAQALERQFCWERRASEKYGREWRAAYLSSYDLLIDETWVEGKRHKRRWSVDAAEYAVRETVEAARYLASQREQLAGRTLVFGCQGVTPEQYAECAEKVLEYARGGDSWVGLGGWCILGRQTSLLPSFFSTLYEVLPMIARAGVGHVHLYGVLYEPALGGFLYLADRYGLTTSTDSSRVIKDCASSDPVKRRKAGARAEGWRENVEHWRGVLAALRESPYYRPPSPLYELEEAGRGGGLPAAGAGMRPARLSV